MAQSPSERTFENPILPGFFPDPGMFRVGDDFYLVTSTFTFFPGVPIFHSTDLVNWRQLGHVLDRPEQMDVEGLQLSEGIFAPTIQHHEGVFYMITTLVGKGGNFVVTATDPAGP
ncbi:MAG: glycoside hydrolase family 43 protein, partial [Mongoliibacter sp.]